MSEPAAIEAPPRELWTRLAYALFALLLVAYGVLAARPGGTLPVWVYSRGLDVLPLVGLLVLALAVVTSVRRPPLLRAGRGLPFACVALVVGSASVRLYFPYPSSREGSPSAVRFRLPVEGAWRVLWGGAGAGNNRIASLHPDRRFALHLVHPDDEATAAELPADFAAWGSVVVAPAAGRVVTVRDGIADTEPGSAPGRPRFGNLVVLRVAEGEYLFLPHLLAGSIEIAEGQSVAAGDWIARVGYSGLEPAVPFPHAALHLQTTPEEHWGEGVPFFVFDYEADGRAVSRGVPRGGLGPDGAWSGQVVRQPGPADSTK